MRITKDMALIEALNLGVDFSEPYLAQSLDFKLAELAKKCGYRKPKNVNASTGQHFFNYLKKLLGNKPHFHSLGVKDSQRILTALKEGNL